VAILGCTGLAHADALYTGDLTLVRQRLDVMELHSFVDFFDPVAGLVRKPGATTGGSSGGGCVCPAGWSEAAGLPDGVFEDLRCACSDLIDWPAASRDGYVGSNLSAVPNALVALSLGRMAEMAGWVGRAEAQERYANISRTIARRMRETMYDPARGAFADGVGVDHAALHSTMYAAVAGAVDDEAVPGMLGQVVATLRS